MRSVFLVCDVRVQDGIALKLEVLVWTHDFIYIWYGYNKEYVKYMHWLYELSNSNLLKNYLARFFKWFSSITPWNSENISRSNRFILEIQGCFNIWRINEIHYINRTKEKNLIILVDRKIQLIKFNAFPNVIKDSEWLTRLVFGIRTPSQFLNGF